MRIWSIHPTYLDTKGLVALWRETLLAKHVLEEKTTGYKNHPQLLRFKLCETPVDSINQYLAEVYNEACLRNYHFDKNKINWNFKPAILTVTSGQMEYEISHLFNKLKQRDKNKFRELSEHSKFKPHPMFRIVKGNIEDWEVLR